MISYLDRSESGADALPGSFLPSFGRAVAGKLQAKGQPMYSITKIIKMTGLIGAFILAATTAQAVSPPPNGSYPGQNTAEGDDAPFSLNAPASGIIWRLTGRPGTQRARHTATLLPNGMVLVAAGSGFHSEILRSAELYDPASRTWSFTGSLDYSTLSTHGDFAAKRHGPCCRRILQLQRARNCTTRRAAPGLPRGALTPDVICTRRRCYKTAWSLLQGDMIPAAVR